MEATDHDKPCFVGLDLHGTLEERKGEETSLPLCRDHDAAKRRVRKRAESCAKGDGSRGEGQVRHDPLAVRPERFDGRDGGAVGGHDAQLVDPHAEPLESEQGRVTSDGRRGKRRAGASSPCEPSLEAARIGVPAVGSVLAQRPLPPQITEPPDLHPRPGVLGQTQDAPTQHTP